MKHTAFIFLILFASLHSCRPASQKVQEAGQVNTIFLSGAEQTSLYFPLIQSRNIALIANQSSLVSGTHLLDTLLSSGIRVKKVFCPEHGFRGKADAGEEISNGRDSKTGIPIISLYGKHKKPGKEELEDIDIVLFDLQDVGVRFYTYISTLSLVMESCAEYHKKIIILDRPNPNADYVDGPVLEKEEASFVGMHEVPVVYGMTIGEYARMVNGESWLRDSLRAELRVIPLKGYDREGFYTLAVPPSPNLPNSDAICLYPSLCFFEGTIISVGRGTDHPFQIIGHPSFHIGSFSFTPESRPGASMYPKHQGKKCFGINLKGYAKNQCRKNRKLELGWLLSMHDFFKDTEKFFNGYFDKLAGTKKLREQIEKGWTEKQIRESWEEGLENFKKTRKKYLIYE